MDDIVVLLELRIPWIDAKSKHCFILDRILHITGSRCTYSSRSWAESLSKIEHVKKDLQRPSSKNQSGSSSSAVVLLTLLEFFLIRVQSLVPWFFHAGFCNQVSSGLRLCIFEILYKSNIYLVSEISDVCSYILQSLLHIEAVKVTSAF